MRQPLCLSALTGLVAAMGWLGGSARAAAFESVQCVPVTSATEHDQDVGWRRTAARLMPVVDVRVSGDSAGLANRRESGANQRPIRLDRQKDGQTSNLHWEVMANWNPLRMLGLLTEKPERTASSRVVCVAGESIIDRLVSPEGTDGLDRGTLADAVRQAHRDALEDALEVE